MRMQYVFVVVVKYVFTLSPPLVASCWNALQRHSRYASLLCNCNLPDHKCVPIVEIVQVLVQFELVLSPSEVLRVHN